MITLGNIIKEYCAEKDISQQEFARQANLSHGLMSLLENGDRGAEVDLDTLRKVAGVIGVTTEQLSKTLTEKDSIGINPLSSLGAGEGKLLERITTISQNPKLLTLFDKVCSLEDEDINLVISLVDRLEKKG